MDELLDAIFDVDLPSTVRWEIFFAVVDWLAARRGITTRNCKCDVCVSGRY